MKRWCSASVFRQTNPLWNRSSKAPLLWLRPLQGTTHRGPPVCHPSWVPKDQPMRNRLLSWSFVPLRRISPGESTPPRFANTGYVPSTGFPTLSTAYSSPERPALFQTGSARGVRPPGVFPRCQVPQLVTAELPSWRFFLRNAYVMRAVRRRASWNFRSSTRTFCRLQGVAPTANPCRWWIIHPVPDGRSPPELSLASPGSSRGLGSRPRRVSTPVLHLPTFCLRQSEPCHR